MKGTFIRSENAVSIRRIITAETPLTTKTTPVRFVVSLAVGHVTLDGTTISLRKCGIPEMNFFVALAAEKNFSFADNLAITTPPLRKGHIQWQSMRE